MPKKQKEVIVRLQDGCTVRSSSEEFLAGDYVRICDQRGREIFFWEYSEWEAEPREVMGAIINAMAGVRINYSEGPTKPKTIYPEDWNEERV